jgi:hypothetical protein
VGLNNAVRVPIYSKQNLLGLRVYSVTAIPSTSILGSPQVPLEEGVLADSRELRFVVYGGSELLPKLRPNLHITPKSSRFNDGSLSEDMTKTAGTVTASCVDP